MNPLNLNEVREYVNENIVDFHERRVKSLEELTLDKLLTKNPYLFRAKNLATPTTLIGGLLDAFLSSSEEKLFGDFLEGLALFVAGKTCNAHKSTAQGVDLEFINNSIHYFVSVKSGPNWGNSSQQKKLEEDLRKAAMRVKQISSSANIQPVLGICYGKRKTTYLRGYLKITGQNFWYLISGNPNLYIDIVEPIGYKAREHSEEFILQKGGIEADLIGELRQRFCDTKGIIDWAKLVEFCCGNFDLDKFLPDKT